MDNEKATYAYSDNAQAQGLPAYVTHAELELAEVRRKRQKRKRAGRFFKVLGVFVLLHWAGSKFAAKHHGRHGKGFWRALEDPEDKWPVPPETQIEHCATWAETDSPLALALVDAQYPFSASASFELPVDSEALFLVTRSFIRRHGKHNGIFAAGSVDYVLAEAEADAGNTVKVDVRAEYWHPEHLNAAKACLLSRVVGENQNGVGILTKWEDDEDWEDHHHRTTELRFQVTVTFPATEEGSALAINSFQSDLEIYSQAFDESMSGVHFKSMELKSALASITAEDLVVDDAVFRASLAAIKIRTLTSDTATLTTALARVEGTYNVTKSLSITTSNAGINVDVNLVADGDDEQPGEVHLTTSNAAIDANVSLSSSTSTPGAFDVTAHTANGHIDLAVPSLPLDALLTLHASTALAKVHVGLPTTYEGTLVASTTLANVDVQISQAEDPKGEGRKRVGGVEKVRRGSVRGSVGWTEEGSKRGSVEVRSSLGGVLVEV
ncbi:hypothetical protein C8F01DRAFT_143803 [Mycena amicta]|nr:hypothetical protein C8F01DRAFT_143803 [Mycena amicta]